MSYNRKREIRDRRQKEDWFETETQLKEGKRTEEKKCIDKGHTNTINKIINRTKQMFAVVFVINPVQFCLQL